MIRTSYLLTLLLVCAFLIPGQAQAPKKWNSADIYEGIQKLNFLGSALYVAAHPDDENTRLISWLANHKKAQTTYLSLTRGDGGQNLIGTEIQELLGLLRTQELLAARRIDGGNQRFSRANDFGYSKHPDETFNIWDKEEILADAVWAIRTLQPDIIINRFNHRTPGTTHGHHTGSAIIGMDAYRLAGSRSAYPEQLEYTDTWKPSRLFFNTSWWFYGSREKFAEADKSKLVSVDVGVYYPVTGKSNTEIAALSRSQHKCQGFGVTGTRGSMDEYLELLKGEMPNGNDPFEGINTTWTRLKGGAPIGEILSNVEKNFKFDKPHESVGELVSARKLINALPDSYWKNTKLAEINQVIKACLALYVEVVTSEPSATPGQEVALTMEFTNRTPVKVSLESVKILPMGIEVEAGMELEYNTENKLEKTITLSEDIALSNPYWLNEKGPIGRYVVNDQKLRGLPETPRTFKMAYVLKIDGSLVEMEEMVVHKFRDPVDGEVFNPFEITPPVAAELSDEVYLFADDGARKLQVTVKAGKNDVQGTVELCSGENWQVEPENYPVALTQKGEEQTFVFTVTPPKEQEENFVVPLVRIGEQAYTNEMITIEYDHIPTQTIYRDASAKTVRIDLRTIGDNVGYIMGASDKVPTSLKQIGYNVTLLEDGDINANNLKKFDAVIVGIRAYNTNERIKFQNPKLLEYVKNGGTLIVQYNTRHRTKITHDEMGPYPFTLSRDRVTVEEAEMRFLAPEHELLNHPNKLDKRDFTGWIQEHGLYYPNTWDEKYTAILSSNDPGEDPKDGGLIVAPYGEGYYIYTGLSFFRELPAGVPGAFRLFANMISIGKSARP
jgi:LmbE family N-acetylglucosaminyl deacetylase